MTRIAVIPVLLLTVSLTASDDKGPSRSATPAAQYRALLKEFEDLPAGVSKAKTADERKQVVARQQSLPLRFLQLAENHSQDPVAREALTQTVALVNGTIFPAGDKDSPGFKALTLLRRDHVTSDKLGRVCQHVAFGFHKSHETFLRAVLEQNPHREVQALACLSLAQFL